eukprot:2402959-Amphidinium_carterae.1
MAHLKAFSFKFGTAKPFLFTVRCGSFFIVRLYGVELNFISLKRPAAELSTSQRLLRPRFPTTSCHSNLGLGANM